MSEQWHFYPCQMGEHAAFIFFDAGISENIDQSTPGNLVKVRVAFLNPRDDGLPTNEEFAALTALEDSLQSLVGGHDGHYVGRVTMDGHRHFYIYTSETEEVWRARIAAFAKEQDYAIAVAFDTDAEHRGYWEELYPSADDWQVIRDMGVLDVLSKHEDDPIISRRIEHWAYFPTAEQANQFVSWLREREYLDPKSTLTDGQYCIRFAHEGTVELADITSHTIRLNRAARQGGGDYDGWETQVCKQT